MKKLIIYLMLAISVPAFAQKDYYVLGSDTLKIGDTVRLGPGSIPDGSYKYVTGLISLGAGHVGQTMTVKGIITRGNKKIGYKRYLKLYPGAGIVNYEAYLDYAFTSKELTVSR